MKHLDLFSGIGGFALATEMVWENVEHEFCEVEPFAQAVLRKHWPQSKIHDDIKTLHPKRNSADLITGGFPCQPFSKAGSRKAELDSRNLWPEMFRVIRAVQPPWVIGENVANLTKFPVFESICADLEGEGYAVQPFIIPACAVGATHRRDRLWIVAHNSSFGCLDEQAEDDPVERQQAQYADTPGIESDWTRVVPELCGMADGLPDRMDRLKSLGNAIVPQVAAEIMKAIKLSA